MRHDVFTPAMLLCPEFITEDGVRKKLAGYEQTENGFVPAYEETQEISTEEALSILLGGEE